MSKTDLLEAIAGKNRGLLATPSDRQAIFAAAAQLEENNPTPRPLESPEKLGGDWRLLYTSSQALLGLDRFPLAKLGQIYQCIRPQRAAVYNIAELYGLPWLESVVSVVARFEPLTEQRVRVLFERSIVGLRGLINYSSPQDYVAQIESGRKFLALDFGLNREGQGGWLEITYLDNDLRISRGNEGSLFVLAKV